MYIYTKSTMNTHASVYFNPHVPIYAYSSLCIYIHIYRYLHNYVYIPTLYLIAPHCNIPHRTTWRCTSLHHTAPHCTTLHQAAPYYSTIYPTSTYCTTLDRRDTATHFQEHSFDTQTHSYDHDTLRSVRSTLNQLATHLALRIPHIRSVHNTVPHCNALLISSTLSHASRPSY